MIDFFIGFLAVVVAFYAGLVCGQTKRQKQQMIEDEIQWLGEPPPHNITHLYAPWKNK